MVRERLLDIMTYLNFCGDLFFDGNSHVQFSIKFCNIKFKYVHHQFHPSHMRNV